MRDLDAHSWVEVDLPRLRLGDVRPDAAARPARTSPRTPPHPGRRRARSAPASAPSRAARGERRAAAVRRPTVVRDGLAALALLGSPPPGRCSPARRRRAAPRPPLLRARARAAPRRLAARARARPCARSSGASPHPPAAAGLRPRAARGALPRRRPPADARPAARAAVRAGREAGLAGPARLAGAPARRSDRPRAYNRADGRCLRPLPARHALLEDGHYHQATVPLAAGARPRARQDVDARGARARAVVPPAATGAAEFEAVVDRAPTNHYALFCLGRALLQSAAPPRRASRWRWPPA